MVIIITTLCIEYLLYAKFIYIFDIFLPTHTLHVRKLRFREVKTIFPRSLSW